MGQLVDEAKKLEQLAKDRAWLLSYFKGEECLCGKPKKTRQALCYGCYKALPKHYQIALYARFGDGFEEALNNATIYLQRYVW